ncbi:hypothetical protein CH249_01930 [Rhodococcus sp. 05-2255-3B1]|nr:hypothetical protein CH250_05435 [Rhodococcus sp. 05-2255-3C]OZE16031.1 hypothetical protein CH249_01930 [Rhodococcus sp. 05-2255-3B1]OZE19071.1 hypothetical protein CH255_13955 [Rhodococcus sp. 05-2255-2A2]
MLGHVKHSAESREMKFDGVFEGQFESVDNSSGQFIHRQFPFDSEFERFLLLPARPRAVVS